MTTQELMELRKSNDAPFDHKEYTVWLHNEIIEKIRHELWNFRELKSVNIKSSYAACNEIMDLKSLQLIK